MALRSAEKVIFDAPVYCPTVQEWKNPIQYIKRIRAEAEKYGICKVRSPPTFNPPRILKKEEFKFKTREQDLREIDGVSRGERRFSVSLELYAFNWRFSISNSLDTKFPRARPIYEIYENTRQNISKQPIEVLSMYKLYIAYTLHPTDYSRIETALFYTPLNHVYRVKLIKLINGCIEPYHKFQTKLEKEGLKQEIRLYRTVTEESLKRKRRREIKKGIDFYKYFPLKKNVFKGQVCDKSSPTEYFIHYFYHEDKLSAKDFNEVLSVSDIEMYLANGRTKESAYMAYENGLCQVCSIFIDSNKTSVKCFECSASFHINCFLANQREELAREREKGNVWFCADCVKEYSNQTLQVSLGKYGYEHGEQFSLGEFEETAKLTLQEILDAKNIPTPSTNEEFEALYWNLVSNESRNQELRIAQPCASSVNLKILYGSDLDTKILGSAFPTQENSFCSRYTSHPWNLNNFPKNQGSLLKYIDREITGVLIPWLYIGMAFSTFCFHTEDHNFGSINYHHFGATKVWYGVPSSDASLFEECCRKSCPDVFKARNDILNGIVTQYDPRELVKISGDRLRMFRVFQEPGDFVITFPKSYHGGFNTGFNCAEAVNFATCEWIPFNQECVKKYKSIKKSPVIASELFLVALALFIMSGSVASESTFVNNKEALKSKLRPEIKRIATTETQKINKALKLINKEKVIYLKDDDTRNIRQCTECLCYSPFSFYFDKSSNKPFCLDHMPHLTDTLQLIILYKHTLLSKLSLYLESK